MFAAAVTILKVEPGSTFKIVTAAADLEEYLRGNRGAYSPEAVFSSSRTRNVEGSTIRCWSDHKNGKHANLTLAGALNNSCNPCFVDIVLSLGKETFYDYLEKFHFGSATGIDFSGEAIGMLLPEATLKNSDLARIGFGQSIAVTPLQLACAAAAHASCKGVTAMLCPNPMRARSLFLRVASGSSIPIASPEKSMPVALPK